MLHDGRFHGNNLFLHIILNLHKTQVFYETNY